MGEPTLARRSDVASSHETVASIAKDLTLADRILSAAVGFWQQSYDGLRSSAAFTDTELTLEIERVTGRRQQRNVIARARDLIMDTPAHPNPNSVLRNLGLHEYDGRQVLHFALEAATPYDVRRILDRIRGC